MKIRMPAAEVQRRRPMQSPCTEAHSGQNSAPWRKVVAGLIIASAAAFVVFFFALTLKPTTISGSDFIQYWSAGVQVAHHADPYDPKGLLVLERRNGLQDSAPTMSISPPVALEVAFLLGLLSAKTGFIVWLMAQLASVLVSIWLLRRIFGMPDSRYHLLGLLFAPVIACLMAGQLGTFFLASFVLFLYLERMHPFWAGASLVPFALKPHLIVVFGVALLVACFVRGRYTAIMGALAATALSCALSLWLDPQAWVQYSALLAHLRVNGVFLPTIGVALRFAIDRSAIWIEFVPEMVACGWAIWYFLRRCSRWNWLEDGSLVMLVSVVSAPYAWVTDQAVLLPAVLGTIYATRKPVPVLAVFAIIEIAMIVQLMKVPALPSLAYLWTAPVWLLWVVYARRTAPRQARHAELNA